MKIAIFGGSFDPLHVGHVEIVNEALNYLNVDKLFIVPTYLNPLKKSSFASAHLRLNWIKKVFSSQNKITILDYEVKQNKPTASIKTVKFIKDNYSNIEKIYFINLIVHSKMLISSLELQLSEVLSQFSLLTL